MFKPEIRVDLKDLEVLTKKYPDASRAARRAKITEALMLLEREVKINTPYGAGPIHLRDTIHSKVNVAGRKVVGLLGTPAQYGEPVELGTKPHFPPVEPLKFWVEKKLGYSGEEAESVAFLIARAISRRGTKGAKMFKRAISDKEAAVERILQEIPAEIIKQVQG